MSLLALNDVTVTTEAGGRQVEVLRDVSLAVAGANWSACGRRIRRRQVDGRPADRRHAAEKFRGERRQRDLPGPRPARHAAARADRPARRRHRLRAPASDDVAQSRPVARRPVRRASQTPRPGRQSGPARTGARRARFGSSAASGRPARPFSAPAFRRPVPARADRHGLRRQAGPDYRRRANHGARRHHPGAGHGTDRRIAARQRDRPVVHHPRSAPRGGPLPAHRRDVCRRDRRDRPGGGLARRSAASLYAQPGAAKSRHRWAGPPAGGAARPHCRA